MDKFAYWLGGFIGQIVIWVIQGASFAFGVYLTVWMLS